jgi:hypothetical protein
MARVNLIARDIGFGLSRDLRLLAAALTSRGHAASVSAIRRGKLRKLAGPWRLRARAAMQRLRGHSACEFDINLMLEEIRPEYLPLARRNVLLPNPEWFRAEDAALLARVEGVFAKTRHAQSIFSALGCRVAFTGFTSQDRCDAGVRRERTFFHLAGRSRNKNTEALLALWRKQPQWPRLTVVQDSRTAQSAVAVPNIDHRLGHLSDDELRRLQNAHRFHLCPSQTEGFGHYLVEALSVGAVTLTLDAAPMNELVTPARGLLVPVAHTATQNLAATNFFDEAAMQRAIEQMIALDDAECDRIGQVARAWFLDNDRAFPERLDAAIRELA